MNKRKVKRVKFKIGSTVQHQYFGIGQVVGYESLRDAYTVHFGKNPGFRRTVPGMKLDAVEYAENVQTTMTTFP